MDVDMLQQGQMSEGGVDHEPQGGAEFEPQGGADFEPQGGTDFEPQGLRLPGAGSLLGGALEKGPVVESRGEMRGTNLVDEETEESVEMLMEQEKGVQDEADPPELIHHGDLDLHDEPDTVCLHIQHVDAAVCHSPHSTECSTLPVSSAIENCGMQISAEATSGVVTVASGVVSDASASGSGGGKQQQQECSGCKKSIVDRFLLKAMDQYWHEDCLKCSCCDCRLGEVGSTLFAKSNLLLCRRDYLRLFGTTGYCSACSKMIPAFEMVMRAKNNVYHLECFACQMCNHRFCVGDRFYLCDNKILCEYDYEERMVFANMTYNYNALSQIKRQTNSLSDDLSSGYGSPSPGSL